jgi:hypothetical protein
MRFLPSDATIADLERKALECEQAARERPKPDATKLKGLAALCREWVVALKSGMWTS